MKSLTLQGRFLELANAECQDAIWKSFIFDLKVGTMKFLLNSAVDTLPTAANLRRWKKSTSDLCKLCRGRQTTSHILNSCRASLDSGRYIWRHNNIVNYVVSCIDTSITLFIPTFQATLSVMGQSQQTFA